LYCLNRDRAQTMPYFKGLYLMMEWLKPFTIQNLNKGGFESIRQQIIRLDDLIMRRQFFPGQYDCDLFTKFN